MTVCKALLNILHELQYTAISIPQQNHNLIEAIRHSEFILPDNIIVIELMEINNYENMNDSAFSVICLRKLSHRKYQVLKDGMDFHKGPRIEEHS